MEVWVVGAVEGDEEASQFWVDADRLVTVRVMQPVGGGTVAWDTRVTAHREMDGYPQESELVMYLDGRLYQEEFYEEVRPGLELDPALFDSTAWPLASRYWE